MSTTKDASPGRVTLWPHQSAFIESVLGSTSGRVVLLCADEGLGRTHALVALAGRELQARPTSRILVLAPKPVCDQLVREFESAGVLASLVDRFRYRAMVDASPRGELWLRGSVTVSSMDFAKLPDIQTSLASVEWSLVVAVDAHQFTGLRAEMLRRFAESEGRVVLASFIDGRESCAHALQGIKMTVVEWRRDEMVGPDGVQGFMRPRPGWHEVSFTASAAEQSLWRLVNDLSAALSEVGAAGLLARTAVTRTLLSSPAALEATLHGLVEHSSSRWAQAGAVDVELSAEEMEFAPAHGDMVLPGRAAGMVTEALALVEALPTDGKLRALGEWMREWSAGSGRGGGGCIVVEYVSTALYLAAELEEIGRPIHVVHGGMSNEARSLVLARCSRSGEWLVACRCALPEGVNLPFVTDLVLYDIPAGKAALDVVLGRFDRYGRQSPLGVHVLVPSVGVEAPVDEGLRFLRVSGLLGSAG